MMNKASGFFAFLLGGIVGAAVALLYAPRSGEETRQLLMENSQEIKNSALKSIREVQDSALAAIDDAQKRIETFNQQAKERITKLQDIGQTTLEEQKASLDKGISEAKDTLAAEPSSVQNPN